MSFPADEQIELSPREVLPLLEDGQAVAIDVREVEELAEGVLPGALHIPLQALPHQAGRLPAQRVIVCYCATGVRSLFAAEALRTAGLAAYSLAGGIEAWQRERLPLEDRPRG